MTPQEKLIKIENTLKELFIERDEPIEAIIRGMLASQNVLLLGPPGTAKSLLIQVLCDHIIEGNFFQTLLHKYSTPEELFGPFSVQKMSEDVFERCCSGWLPEAHFGFIDEVFKANPGILNTLLPIMNERVFYNGRTPVNVPLFTLIAASNEVPDSEDNLEALYDRFHIKIITRPIQEASGFAKMLTTDFNIAPETLLTITEVNTLQRQVLEIEFPEQRLEQLINLRNDFKKEGIPVTDRMWKQSLKTIQACALMEGRNKVEEIDLAFLRHMFWSDPDHEAKVADMIYDRVSPDRKEALKLLNKAESVVTELNKVSNAGKKMTEGVAAAQKIKEIRMELEKIMTKRRKYKEDMRDFDKYWNKLASIGSEITQVIGWEWNVEGGK